MLTCTIYVEKRWWFGLACKLAIPVAWLGIVHPSTIASWLVEHGMTITVRQPGTQIYDPR
jgi:hypothetical protein